MHLVVCDSDFFLLLLLLPSGGARRKMISWGHLLGSMRVQNLYLHNYFKYMLLFVYDVYESPSMCDGLVDLLFWPNIQNRVIRHMVALYLRHMVALYLTPFLTR